VLPAKFDQAKMSARGDLLVKLLWKFEKLLLYSSAVPGEKNVTSPLGHNNHNHYRLAWRRKR